jgi:hypothetical protein
LAYPIHGGNTFHPSGSPDTDPPERSAFSELDFTRRALRLDTPEGIKEFDQFIADHRGPKGLASIESKAYWDRIRRLQMKSPRARKRAEEREHRQAQNAEPK